MRSQWGKLVRGVGTFALALVGFTSVAIAQEAFTAGHWTAVTTRPRFGVGHIQLLTDGSVLALNSACNPTGTWLRLVPDSTGSYINGHWVAAGNMPAGYNPLYFASQTLPNGDVVVMGGEYNACISGWTNLGALYNPHTNKWTSLAAPTGWNTVGDASSVVLPSGKMMLANCCTKEQAILTLTGTTASWAPTGTAKFDVNDEEGWTLLPNGKVLAVDAYVGVYNATGKRSELYTPGTGAWTNAGSTVVQLWDSAATCGGGGAASSELGPAVLRPDGSVFATGANKCGAGHTAIYQAGKWTAGPDFAGVLNVADGPAALLPNGNVLVNTSPGIFAGGSSFFEWDGTALNTTAAPPNAPVNPSYVGDMLVLPTGQIMYTDFSTNVQIYTATGTACAGCAPTVTSVASTLTHGTNNNVIKGTQFNGLSQGAAYGDDNQNDTNFPLVRITDSLGHVVYCRTHGFAGGVATGTKIVTAQFDVPATIALGAATLEVVANGIPSAGVGAVIQ